MAEAPISFYNTPEDIIKKDKILESNEYKIQKDYEYINILIGKTEDNILIRSLYYEISLNPNDLTILTKCLCNSLDEAYELIKNTFEQKKVVIKEINKNMIKLIIILYDIFKRKEKEIEICLMAQFKNEEFIIHNIINKYNELEQELNNIKSQYNNINEENTNLKNEIISLKLNGNNYGIKYKKIMNIIYEDKNKLKEENNLIKKEIILLKEKNDVIIKENKNIKERLNQMNNENEEAKKFILSLKSEIERLKNYSYNNSNKEQKVDDIMVEGIKKVKSSANICENDSSIGVIFKNRIGNSKPIYVYCSSNEKISNLIKNYREKTENYNNNLRFEFNSQRLEPSMTIKEAGITFNSIIFVT